MRVEVQSWDGHVYVDDQHELLSEAKKDAETQVQVAAGSYRSATIILEDGTVLRYDAESGAWKG